MNVVRSILLFQFLLALQEVKMIKAEETMMNSARDNSFDTRMFLKDKLSRITHANYCPYAVNNTLQE